MTIYTPDLPMSRVESFIENRVFSNPDVVDWASLTVEMRRDFISRSDRGVFGPSRIAAFAYDERCHFVQGRVLHVASADRGRSVRVEHDGLGGGVGDEHDYLINCTGFDILEQLRALSTPSAQAEIEGRIGPLWDGSTGSTPTIGHFLELCGMDPRLHLPGLAGLDQGPGFANLGSLGLLADRIMQPFGPLAAPPMAPLTGDRATHRQVRSTTLRRDMESAHV